MIGRYIVADPEICHGTPTIRGTRIMVWQVLEQIARGTDWETISDRWRGKVSRDAVEEVARLGVQAFNDHYHDYEVPEYVLERVSA